MILKNNVPRQIPMATFLAMAALTALVLPSWSQETPPSAEPTTPTEKSNIEKALDSPVIIEYEGIHVSEILDFIGNEYDINIVLDWRVVEFPPVESAWPVTPGLPGVPATAKSRTPWRPERHVTDGMVEDINVVRIPLRQALTALLRPLNLTFVVEPSLVWISSPAMIEADAARPKPPAQSDDKEIMKTLAQPVSIEFEDIHISQLLEFVSDSYDVNIVVDKGVVTPRGATPANKKSGSPGFATDGYVKSIRLNNVTLSEMLGAALRMLDLTFMPDNGFIWVSSPERITQPPLSAEAVQPVSAEKTSALNPEPTPAPSDELTF